MRLGWTPFRNTSEDDNLYMLVIERQYDQFWQAVSEISKERHGVLSSDFKELFWTMVSYHPHERLCLAELAAHPFV